VKIRVLGRGNFWRLRESASKKRDEFVVVDLKEAYPGETDVVEGVTPELR